MILSGGSETSFLVTDGSTRNFRTLTMDDVDVNANGSGYQFYDSDTVYDTTLDGYDKGNDGTAIDGSDTPLSALGKMENQLSKKDLSRVPRLYEDGVADKDEANNIYASKYAIEVDDNNDVFVSSYSIFSLPDGEVPNGFSVTIKSDNGPVYIYAAYDNNSYNDPPQIEAISIYDFNSGQCVRAYHL